MQRQGNLADVNKATEEVLVPSVPGAVVRALGALVDQDAVHEACRVVHAFPRSVVWNEDTGETKDITILEAIEGRVFVRATYRSVGIAQGILIDATTAGRFTADEQVEIIGQELVAPFRLRVSDDQGKPDEGVDGFPNLDPLVPKREQRLLFVIDPKEMATALKTMQALGCKAVEVLAPEYRGGPLGLRGHGQSAEVEACVMPRNPFARVSPKEDDVDGQRIFDFRETEAEIAARLDKARTVGKLVQALIDTMPEGSALTVKVGAEEVTIDKLQKAVDLSDRILGVAAATAGDPLDILERLKKEVAKRGAADPARSFHAPAAEAAAGDAPADVPGYAPARRRPPEPDFGEGLDEPNAKGTDVAADDRDDPPPARKRKAAKPKKGKSRRAGRN